MVTISSSGMRTQRNSMYSGGSATRIPSSRKTQANEATSVPVMFPSHQNDDHQHVERFQEVERARGAGNVYRCAYSPPATPAKAHPR